ncbi:MAG: hypothetical protein JO284_02160 [Planctomycetaceae bacterium]|nr:hypothetical protein [Planctomycetaceae bacterium]
MSRRSDQRTGRQIVGERRGHVTIRQVILSLQVVLDGFLILFIRGQSPE